MSEIALPIARVPPGLALPGRLLSDERLARLASAGNQRALAVLYERHHQALYRYCRSIVRDHDDAQDALQSTMTHAFVALRARERDLAVRPWLFRIAHNEAVSILRKRRPDDSLLDEHLPSDVSVERTVDQRERLQMLVADLKALPERQRAALLMRELSGLSIEEIAAALSVSRGAAKQTVFEARGSLHELAEGRAMECETVRRAISDGDGRVLRGRGMRAHLRGCAGCRDFRAVIDTRKADLRALAPPLPATAATAMLARLLAHGAGGGHAGAAAAASTAALGNHAAASLLAKGLAGVAIATVATAGTVHLLSSSERHKQISPPGQRSTSPASGAVGEGIGVHSGVRTSTPQPPRGHLKASGAGAAGLPATGGPTLLPLQRTASGASTPIRTQRAGGGGGRAYGRSGSAGGSSKHPANRRSSSPQSRRGSHGRHSSKQAHPAPPQQAGKGKQGQTPIPAGEHSRHRP
jgi:RNA polymerase sigma factor (sigma-70 family)